MAAEQAAKIGLDALGGFLSGSTIGGGTSAAAKVYGAAAGNNVAYAPLPAAQKSRETAIQDAGRAENAKLPDTGFTPGELQTIQSIGRKSVNSFSAQDTAATEKIAQRHWEELGKKSPFYRAQAGDWRVSDPAPVTVATQPGDTRGVQKNTDTGWDVQVSGKVFAESQHFARKNTAAIPYLPYINDIVKNAVLLDSYGVDSQKAKSQNTLLMHSMYAVADIGNGPELLKLYIEEMHDPNRTATVKRAYQLQNIEKASAANGGVQGNAPSSLANTTDAVRTVADLFAAVKAKDAQFQPKPAGKRAAPVVGWDGREVVKEATGPSVTVDGKKYLLLGYDAKGLPVYEDAQIVQEQEAAKNSGAKHDATGENFGNTLENAGKDSTIKLENMEVRKWYHENVSQIKENIDPNLPMEERAMLAFEARNRIRTEARNKMIDEETRKLLDVERPNLTFEMLIESKMKRKGMTREDAIQDIFETATKTNENVDREFGIGGK